MPPSATELVTDILADLRGGNRQAAEELLPIVYGELRKLARAKMAREAPGHTLQPTALVHEAYLRLVKDPEASWEGRAHFFAAAAEAMRRILIERARRYRRQKHGGDHQRVTFAEPVGGSAALGPEELLALDAALERLEGLDEAMSGVVKLRCFAGLSVEETAEALGISTRTVKRHWAAALAWLNREMSRS